MDVWVEINLLKSSSISKILEVFSPKWCSVSATATSYLTKTKIVTHFMGYTSISSLSMGLCTQWNGYNILRSLFKRITARKPQTKATYKRPRRVDSMRIWVWAFESTNFIVFFFCIFFCVCALPSSVTKSSTKCKNAWRWWQPFFEVIPWSVGQVLSNTVVKVNNN